MTENSMFFSDGSWYTQNMFARFISDIFGEGVVDGIDNELEVSANTPANMAVQVKTGRSYVKGYIHEILTDAVQLTISDADTTNPRIDRIVLRLDVNTNRRIRVAVLKGTAAASPVAPTLTQTSATWEISLAQVYVSANATVINSGNITDERTFMTMQVDNLPKASSTGYGAVKVGSGLDISNGVVSLAAVNSVFCDNISTANSSGFKVGEMTFTYNQHTLSNTWEHTSGAWTNLGNPYTPTLVRVSKRCAPFTYDPDDITLPTITAKMNFVPAWVDDTSRRLTTGWGLRAIKVGDGTVLGSATGSTSTVGAVTATITLPSDWEFGTDVIQFQYYVSYISSAYGQGKVTAGDFINNLENAYTIYYSPVAEVFT